MDISETDRYHLFDWFETHMGPELAPTMIKSLPPVNWTDVATKDDLATLDTSLRGDMAGLRGEMAGLRGEMAELRGEIRGEMGAMEARLTAQSSQQLRLLFFGMIGSNATLVGLVFAAVRLAEA